MSKDNLYGLPKKMKFRVRYDVKDHKGMPVRVMIDKNVWTRKKQYVVHYKGGRDFFPKVVFISQNKRQLLNWLATNDRSSI